MGAKTKKRWSTLHAKPGQLLARYGRPDPFNRPDLCYAWGGDGAEKSDVRVLMRAFEELHVHGGRSLREELTLRGYDITTLRFSIERLPEADTPTPSLALPASAIEGGTEP